MALQLLQRNAGLPVTLAEARTRLRLDDTLEDAELTALIRTAQGVIEKHITGTLLPTRWRWTLNAFCELVLPRAPVISVEQIRYKDTAGQWQTLSPSLYSLIPSDLGNPSSYLYAPAGWPGVVNEPACITIEFTSGYADAAAIEPELITALLMLAGHYDQNREATTSGNSNEITMGVQFLIGPYMWMEAP